MRLIDADDFGNRMYHEAFEKNSDLQKWDSGCWIRYKLFENVLREQPTVEPEHKTGRWMFGFNNQYLEKYYYCSNCGCRKHTEDEPSDYFCPNCGADMRGTKND